MKLKKFFWDYLYFTQIERYGLVFLLAFCLAFFAVPRFYRWFSATDAGDTPEMTAATPVFAKNEIVETENLRSAKAFRFNPNLADYDDFIALGLSAKTAKSILNYRSKGGTFRRPEDLAKIYTLSEKDFERLRPFIVLADEKHDNFAAGNAPENAPEVPAAPLQPFDPNSVSAEQLRALGLPAKTVQGWQNYLSKGGRFRFKEDVKRLYNLSENDYERLLPFVTLPSKTDGASGDFSTSKKMSKSADIQIVDINTAETNQWTRLPGIGEGWARKILNWRDKLGGFSSVGQVAETRHLPDSVFQKVRPFLVCGKADFSRISINTADWKTLNEHPYIEANQARWIIAYREQHGNYRSVDDLLKIPEIKRDWLDRVKPYLSVGLL